MIKNINPQNFLTTPFVAAKGWNLFNNDNEDLVALEGTGSEFTVALEFFDYSVSPPAVNSSCSIALEQQSNDELEYQEAITGSGTFFPDSEPTNPDGTYKRLVHSQIASTFYNAYGNPIEILGMDYIDFPLGKTLRNLSESARVFTIPRNIFGERIQENTVFLMDNSLDDNVEIVDDGYQNLIAKTNLFSKVQEVRHLGNVISEGTSSFVCSGDLPPSPPVFAPVLSAMQVGFNVESLVQWTYEGTDQTDFLLERSFDSGSTWTDQIPIADPSSTSYDDLDVFLGETIWYRISAHNILGYGPLSNTGSVFIAAESACSLDPTLFSGSVGIQGYFDGLIPNPVSSTPSGVTWDGTFNKYDYSPDFGGSGHFYSGEIEEFDIQGNNICINTLNFNGCDDSVGSWTMTINDGGCGQILWRGTLVGTSPFGVYNYEFDSVGNDGPATLTVVLVGGATSLLEGGSFCCT